MAHQNIQVTFYCHICLSFVTAVSRMLTILYKALYIFFQCHAGQVESKKTNFTITSWTHVVLNNELFVEDLCFKGSGHYSDSPLLRRPIIPTAHCSDSPFLRQPIIPSKMVKSSIIILKSVVFLLYLTKD
jgi:hypothetical protein